MDPNQQPAPQPNNEPATPVSPQPSLSLTPPVSAPTTANKPPKKLIITIAAIVAGIVALSAVVWMIFTLISSNLALKEYSNDLYSLLVPESYTQKVVDTDATFVEPKATEDNQSQVQVSAVDSSVGDKQLYIDAIDKSLTAEALSADAGDDNTLTNVKIEKATQNGNPTRVVTADIEEGGKKIGIFRYVVTFGDKNIYMVIVVAHESDPGLEANAAKITDSFKIK